MSHEEAALMVVLRRLGIEVTQDPRPERGWGWSMDNERLVRPRVGAYATRDEAASAALSWLLDTAWRGVLFPILQTAHPEESGSEQADDEGLLEPWARALQNETLSVE